MSTERTGVAPGDAATPSTELPHQLPALPSVSSRELLGDGKELLIEHRGAWYRLRETALGKLILTK